MREAALATGALGEDEDASLRGGGEKLHETGTGSKRIRLQGFASVLSHFKKVGSASPAAPSAHQEGKLSFFKCSPSSLLGDAPMHPVKSAGFGLNFRIFFLFPGFTPQRRPEFNKHCFPRFPDRFQVANQALPAASAVGICTKARRVIANICIQSQNWETLG